jgi:hypothetical protein
MTGGGNLSDIPAAAWQRLFCYVIISRLSDKSINDAWRSLIEIYTWEWEQNRFIAKVPTVGTLPVSSISRIERTPFIIDENL